MRVLLAAQPALTALDRRPQLRKHPGDVEVGPQAGLGAVHALPRDELVSLAVEALELRIGALGAIRLVEDEEPQLRPRQVRAEIVGVVPPDLGVGVLDHVRREEDDLRHLRRRHRRREPRVARGAQREAQRR